MKKKEFPDEVASRRGFAATLLRFVAGELPAVLLTATTTVAATPPHAGAAGNVSARAAKFTLFTTQQQPKPKIANEVEPPAPKNKEKGTTTTEKVKERPKPAREAVKTPWRRHNSRAGRWPKLDVTITTNVPEAEIFINNGGGTAYPQSLGKTDIDGRLTIKLAPGSHSLTASRRGYRILRQQIEVRPGATAFSFDLSLPAFSNNPTVAAAANNAADPFPAAATRAAEGAPPGGTPTDKESPVVEEVINRYLDAGETGGVAADDWELVQSQTDTALAEQPDNTQLRAQSLFAQGQLAFLRGDYPSALVAFNRATLVEPKSAAVYYGLGNAYLATNQPAESLKSYQRATELNPELALAYKGIGDALSKQGKSREALSYYDRFRNFGGQPAAGANVDAALGLMKRKRWAQALKELQEVSKAENSAAVNVYIGDCHVGLEQPLSASQAYFKATELDPKSSLAYYKYGEVMLNMREYAAAVEALERSLALDLTGAKINRARAREMANKAAEKMRKMN